MSVVVELERRGAGERVHERRIGDHIIVRLAVNAERARIDRMLAPAVIILRAQILAGQFHVAVVRAPLESRRAAVEFAVTFIVARVDAAGAVLLPRTEHAVSESNAVAMSARMGRAWRRETVRREGW